ncbi:hypothetical protein Tco_1278240 [Tanacetum coccineum]
MEEEGERYSSPFYVGGLHAYDEEINLAHEKKFLSNEFAVKMCLDYVEKEKEEEIIKVKGEALKEKKDPWAFVIPIRLEARINLNALVDNGFEINVMPYRVNKTEQALALQTVINPLWKVCVWKKAASFLGSFPVPLEHLEWKHEYQGCHSNEKEASGQWRTEIRLTDPYGNVYMQGFTMKKATRRLSKYQSDIMSPNYTPA